MMDEIICSERYGKHNAKKCTRGARWIFTGDGKLYCGLHARKFLKAGLRPVFHPTEQAVQLAKNER